jgi:hypothetical protein
MFFPIGLCIQTRWHHIERYDNEKINNEGCYFVISVLLFQDGRVTIAREAHWAMETRRMADLLRETEWDIIDMEGTEATRKKTLAHREPWKRTECLLLTLLLTLLSLSHSYGVNLGIGNMDDDLYPEIANSYDNHQLQVFKKDGIAVVSSSNIHASYLHLPTVLFFLFLC